MPTQIQYGIPLPVVRRDIVRPALWAVGILSAQRETIVTGTGAKESEYRHVFQVGGGPALGLFQMERETHDDIWNTFLRYRPELRLKVLQLVARNAPSHPEERVTHWTLVADAQYAAAMAGIRYLRAPGMLPPADDAAGQAAYWLRNYNAGGKGTLASALPHFQRAITEVLV